MASSVVVRAVGVPTFVSVFVGYASSDEVVRPGRVEHVSSVLNPDGTLRLEAGFSGSLDPAGYQMVTGPAGKPRFVPGNTSVTSPEPDPDDVYWDDQFGVPGVDGYYLYAVAIDASGNV
jgi:hypothetical protein